MKKEGAHFIDDSQRRSQRRTDSHTAKRSAPAHEAPRAGDAPRRSASRSSAPQQTARRSAPRSTAAQPTARRSSPTQSARSPQQPPRRATVQPPHADGGTRRASAPPPRSGSRSHRRKHRRGGFPLWPVIAVLVVVIGVSLFMLGKTILGYTSNRSDYNEVQNAAIIPRLPTATPEPGQEPTEQQTVEKSEIPFDVDWDMLRETNSEIIAWLYCPDTIINYPVMQTTDNEKYLTINFSGKENAGGALFADYDSVIGLRSSHLIIYGHNMKDNSMFGTLKSYGDEAYFEEHPVFYLLTPNQAYRIDLLDCLTIDATLDNYPTYFGDDGSLENYVGRISSMAYWVNSEADYQNHQLVTMSTCTSSDDQRLILQGVLVPIE